MTKFEKPGSKDWDYPDMAELAGKRALNDAGIAFSEIEQVAVGYCYGDSTCGQRAVYQLAGGDVLEKDNKKRSNLTGVPIYNVNNNCATGSTALFMAKQFVEGGICECAMALGFEKMEKGSLGSKFQDRTNPMDKHMMKMMELYEFKPSPPAAQMFGNAGREHMEKYGTNKEAFAKIAYKNHRNSVRNPYSQFRDEYSMDQILNSPMVHAPLTKLQCCPTSDGSACAIVASEAYVKKHGLEGQAIEIIGMTMATDTVKAFNDSMISVIGADMTASAASTVYKQSGYSAKDIDVLELHDCFSANELVTYEALGLCEQGQAGAFIESGGNDYGGQTVVNPSGGLISKGHPLGATGLAQCAEMVWQLRGECGDRQVKDAKIAASHNLGLGGAVVFTMYKKPSEWTGFKTTTNASGALGFPADTAQVAKL